MLQPVCDSAKAVPHQIPQIADGRVRPEHIGYNAAITALLTIDWKEPPQVSETDYRQEIFDFLKEVQISFTQKEQIYRLVEKAVEANMEKSIDHTGTVSAGFRPGSL